MMRARPIHALPAVALGLAFALTCVTAATAHAQDARMSFFLTSEGPGDGANLGGLRGADEHCAFLAYRSGFGDRTWRAYLSTSGTGGVNARDRIGSGPWHNAKGVLIAQSVADLHSDKANIDNDTALDEQGRTINSEGAPNRHDILTGSDASGMATDMTCENWTSSSSGSAMVGHHDRLAFGKPGSPWSSAHPSKGCSVEELQASGGAGLLYCFAAD
jgi:hypothetical protein